MKKENILITGGTGLISTHLSALLMQEGYSVGLLSRRQPARGNIPIYHWNIENMEADAEAIKNADHIIHLAGASIATGRWTKKRKAELYNSRVEGARVIFKMLNKVSHHVKTFISASAVGYYGDGGDRLLTEDSPPGDDFLARLCADWEHQAMNMKSMGIRTVIIRTGIVLSRNGGALPEFAKPLRFGAAVYMGDGKQYLSWIHINDICMVYLQAIRNKQMNGAYNAVAPSPVTNFEMIKAIREVKQSHAPLVPAPAFTLKLALGEMSHALLAGQRCSCEKLLKTGFRFEYSDLHKALSRELEA